MDDVNRIFDLLQLYRTEFSAKECVFGYKREGKWKQVSARTYVEQADAFTNALMASGFRAGDRIATILGNMPEWNFLDMGILQCGCVHVPVYPSLSAENYRFIFEDAGVKMIIVGCHDAWDRIKQPVTEMRYEGMIISVEKIDGLASLDEFTAIEHDPLPLSQLFLSGERIEPGSLATIIYTSGTTGYPKGVMLSHANLVSNFVTVSRILKNYQVNRALSFLPLSHVYERMMNYMYQYLGISVYYAEHFDRIRDNLREVQPDMFCAVPRVIEKSYAAILRKGKSLSGPRKMVFHWAMHLGFIFDQEKLKNPLYRLKLRVADLLVFRKWRTAFGNHLQFIVSGGAPLNPKLARIFWAAGMKVIEGYGLTETSPVIATGNFDPGGFCFGTVGPVIQDVEVSFTPFGEILCRGPNVMMGYVNNPEKTAEVIDADGWFHTGDVGELVDGKFLKITDRKKEIFKTSGGKYIAPQVVENKLKESPFIENLIVIGENRNFPTALIVPNFDYLRSWCKDKGIAYSCDAEMVRSDVVKSRIQRDVSMLNQSLDHPSQIRKFTIMDKEWTVQTGELSFTLKVRRTHLQAQYARIISAMYPDSPEMHQKHREKKKKKKRGR